MKSNEFKEKIENSPTILNRHILLVNEEVLSIIKDLEEKEKQDKILKIIKEKNVDIKHLKHFIKCYTKEVGLKTYNDYHSKEELTQEEYDLFEEWLDGKNDFYEFIVVETENNLAKKPEIKTEFRKEIK